MLITPGKFIFLYYILILFLFIPCHGFGQEEEVVTIPRQLSLFLVFNGDFEEDEEFLLKQTLLIKLAEDSDINLVEPLIEQTMTPRERNSRAEEIGADCWLVAEVTAGSEKIKIIYSSYDLLNNVFVIEEKQYEKNRKIRSLHRSFWQDIIIDISKNYSQITGKLEIKEVIEYQSETKDAVEEKGVKVVIEAFPGTRILGLTKDAPLIVGERGLAKIELAQLKTYTIKAKCAGFYPLERSFYVEYEPVKITLQQTPGSRWAVDAYLHQFDYLGLGVLFYILPNFFFIELSSTTYIKKLIWPVEDDLSDWEVPLFPVFLTAGFYINGEDEFIRYGLNFGVFLRLFYDEGLIFDKGSRWGIKLLGFHAELSGMKKIRFFYEHNILVYFIESTDAMKDTLLGGRGNTLGYIFNLHGQAINLMDVKVGVRFIF